MFGFSFESWEQVTDVMYVGIGFEGIWTFIAVVFCIAMLAIGATIEKNSYEKHSQ